MRTLFGAILGVVVANAVHAADAPPTASSAESHFARETGSCPKACPFVGASVTLPDRDLERIFALVTFRSGRRVRDIAGPVASDRVPEGTFAVNVIDSGDCVGGQGRKFFVAKRRSRWRVVRIEGDVGWGCIARAPTNSELQRTINLPRFARSDARR